MHLPHWVENEWLKQFVAEQLVTVRTKRGFRPAGMAEAARAQPEALDCRVYAPRPPPGYAGADRWPDEKWRDLEDQLGAAPTDTDPAGKINRPGQAPQGKRRSDWLGRARRMVLDMTDWTETELSALRRAYASGTTRVSYDGKSVDYGSAEDLLARIRTIERAIAGVSRPLPVARAGGLLARRSVMFGDLVRPRHRHGVAPRMAARRVLARQAFETLTRGYDGAARGRRTEGWRAPGSSADTEIPASPGRCLRDRMRDLVRQQPARGEGCGGAGQQHHRRGDHAAPPPAATTSSIGRSMPCSNAGRRSAIPTASSTSTGCRR